MKNLIRKSPIWTAVLALVLVVSLSLPSALAYFTTFSTAEGSVPLIIENPYIRIRETFSDKTKKITLENTGTVDCWVRVRVYTPDFPANIDGETQINYDSNLWTKDSDAVGEYYMYKKILAPGETTQKTLDILLKAMGKIDWENFDIVVVQECTKVFYHEDGTPYADWSWTPVTGGAK